MAKYHIKNECDLLDDLYDKHIHWVKRKITKDAEITGVER